MQGHSTLFVGRGRELELLQSRLNRAFAGAGSVTALVGEPGIGKTSTALAFGETAWGEGATVLRGACAEGDWGQPFLPWREMLRDLVHERGAERTTSCLGPSANALGALVPELRNGREPAILGTRDERLRLYDAVAQVLLRASEDAPLVLVFEDLQWADDDTVALLGHVARFSKRARWALLATFRESEIDARAPLAELLATLRREADYQRIPLRGFALDEVTEYLTRSAGRELPPAIVRLVFDETVGNPFYVREVLRHLLEEGKIAPRDGAFSAELGRRPLGIPVGVREVVGRRLSRLSEDAGRVLQIASALTGPIRADLLFMLAELEEGRLRDCIDEALTSGLLRATHEGTYEFAHAIVRRTIYDGQNPDRRARMHRRIAESLESEAPRARAYAAEIAAQYHASLVLPGAEQGVAHARAAAADAHRGSAQEHTVTFLRLARDLASTAPLHVRVGLLRELAHAEAIASKVEDACASTDVALQEMESYISPREDIAAFLTVVIAELKAGGAPIAAWEPLVQRGLVLIGRKRDLPWARMKLLEDRTEPIASGAVHIVRCRPFDPQAMRIARERGEEADYAMTIEHAFRTRAETDALVRVAKGWVHPASFLKALDAIARDLIFRHGAFREARTHVRQMMAIGERSGSIRAQAEGAILLSHCDAALGEGDAARETRVHAKAMVERLGTPTRAQSIAALGMETTFAYLFGGEWGGIAQPAARMAADPNGARSPVGHIAAGIAVLGYALAGYAKESRSLLGHLAPVFERCDALVYHYGVALDCALIAVWHLGAADLAARYVSLAERAAPELGMCPFSVRALNVARMRILLADAEADTAADAIAEPLAHARDICDRGGLRPLRAIVDHDEAAGLLRAGDASVRPRALELLEDSLVTFRDLAMAPWIAHTLQLLGDDALEDRGPSSRRRPRAAAGRKRA